jgi:hypothetical protein
VGLVLAIIVSLSLVMPTLGIGQTGGTSLMRQSAIESLHDSQWVRLASPDIGRREGRLLARNRTELILTPAPDPVRIPAAEIDTIWTRGSSTKTGLLVGALLGAALGAVAGSSLGEADTDRVGFLALSIGAGTAGGGLLGALFGTALPRWKRSYP